MTNPVLYHVAIDDHGILSDGYYWWCPGCAAATATPDQPEGNGTHMFRIPPWSFDNGDMEHPTFGGSYLAYDVPAHGTYPGHPRCHSFVRDGRIEYLTDSTHPLAGQTVDMVPLPDWLCRERGHTDD